MSNKVNNSDTTAEAPKHNRDVHQVAFREHGISENINPILDTVGNIVTKNEEQAEILNNLFALDFNSKNSRSQGTQPPELEDRGGEQNEAPIIQGEMASDLLHHLDTHKSMGPGSPSGFQSLLSSPG